MRLLASLLMVVAHPVLSAAVATVTPGDWALYRSTTILSRHASETACVDAAKALNVARTYTCRTQTTVAVTLVANPVNCVVSAWGPDTLKSEATNADGSKLQTWTHTRTITTQPANGGTACPALTETWTVTIPASVTTIVWTRAQVEDGGTFTLYTSATVRYGQEPKWSQRTFPPGTYACSNAMWGSDPYFGAGKYCEVSPASALVKPVTPATGTASLTWVAPTLNTDGTPLTNLAGYKVYYAQSATGLAFVAQVSALSYTFNGLASGTHYYGVSAVDAQGGESAMVQVFNVIP